MPGLKDLILRLQEGEVDFVLAGDFALCRARSQALDLDGTTIRGLTLDALLEATRAIGRPRDLPAVLELEAIREKLNPKP